MNKQYSYRTDGWTNLNIPISLVVIADGCEFKGTVRPLNRLIGASL